MVNSDLSCVVKSALTLSQGILSIYWLENKNVFVFIPSRSLDVYVSICIENFLVLKINRKYFKCIEFILRIMEPLTLYFIRSEYANLAWINNDLTLSPDC